jgi:hypothetical protein
MKPSQNSLFTADACVSAVAESGILGLVHLLSPIAALTFSAICLDKVLLPVPLRPSRAIKRGLFRLSQRCLISSIISVSLTSFIRELYQKSITIPVCETLIFIQVLMHTTRLVPMSRPRNGQNKVDRKQQRAALSLEGNGPLSGRPSAKLLEQFPGLLVFRV